ESERQGLQDGPGASCEASSGDRLRKSPVHRNRQGLPSREDVRPGVRGKPLQPLPLWRPLPPRMRQQLRQLRFQQLLRYHGCSGPDPAAERKDSGPDQEITLSLPATQVSASSPRRRLRLAQPQAAFGFFSVAQAFPPVLKRQKSPTTGFICPP